MNEIQFDQNSYLRYTDPESRDWQYWPLSAAELMWCEVTCNQYGCHRPAVFVGIVNVLGDGTSYYDSAAAWCYWCMPRTAMTPEAERVARHAEWARQASVDECLGLVRQFRDEQYCSDPVDEILTRLISFLRSATETRERVLSYSMLTPSYIDGRMHTPEMCYAVRPGSGMESALRSSNNSEND